VKKYILCAAAVVAMPASAVSRDVLRLADERLEDIATALRSYAAECGRLPDPLELETELVGTRHGCWSGPHLSIQDLRDPWRRPFVYKIKPGVEFSLRSIGVDGMPETADDIVYGDASRFWVDQYKTRPDNIVDEWRNVILIVMAASAFYLLGVLAKVLIRRRQRRR
jgi:hypothetical protein